MKKIWGMVMVLVMVFVVDSAYAVIIPFDFPTEVLQRVRDAYTDIYDYESNGNGLTEKEFVKSRIIHEVKEKTENWEVKNKRDVITVVPLRQVNPEYDPNLPIDPNSNPQYLEIK